MKRHKFYTLGRSRYIWCLKKPSGNAFRRLFFVASNMLPFSGWFSMCFLCWIQVIHAATCFLRLPDFYRQSRLNQMLPWFFSIIQSAKNWWKNWLPKQPETFSKNSESPQAEQKKKLLPSLKRTWPLKIDGWKMSFLLGWPVFRGELLVLGSVPPDLFMILIFTRFSVGFLVLLFHGRIRVDLARFIFLRGTVS